MKRQQPQKSKKPNMTARYAARIVRGARSGEIIGFAAVCLTAGGAIETWYVPKGDVPELDSKKKSFYSRLRQGGARVFLIGIFVIGIVNGSEAAFASGVAWQTIFSAETHEPLVFSEISVPDVSEDEEFPIPVAFHDAVGNSGQLFGSFNLKINRRSRRNRMILGTMHGQRFSQFVERRCHWETYVRPEDAMPTISNAGFRAPGIYDDEASCDRRVILEERRAALGGRSRMVNPDVSNTQYRTLFSDELQPSDGMLFLLNVGLVADNSQLSVSNLGHFGGFKGCVTSSYCRNAGSPVSAKQEISLDTGNTDEQRREKGQNQGVKTDGIGRYPQRLSFAAVLSSFVGGLLVAGLVWGAILYRERCR